MRTSKNHRINICILHRLQIILNDLLCHHVFFKSFFHQRYKQRTCFLNYRDFRIHRLNHLGIHSALYCSFCSNNSYFSILGGLNSCPCSRDYYSENGNIKFIFHCIQCQRTSCITCDNNRFYILCLKEANNLFRETDDRIL